MRRGVSLALAAVLLLAVCGALPRPREMECIILTVNNDFMDAGGYAHEQLQ